MLEGSSEVLAPSVTVPGLLGSGAQQPLLSEAQAPAPCMLTAKEKYPICGTVWVVGLRI